MPPLELQMIYLKTIVSIEKDGVLVPLGRATLGGDSRIHVITPCNPGAERPTRADNDVANEKLRVGLVGWTAPN